MYTSLCSTYQVASLVFKALSLNKMCSFVYSTSCFSLHECFIFFSAKYRTDRLLLLFSIFSLYFAYNMLSKFLRIYVSVRMSQNPYDVGLPKHAFPARIRYVQSLSCLWLQDVSEEANQVLKSLSEEMKQHCKQKTFPHLTFTTGQVQ
jgi:hypothetical protein